MSPALTLSREESGFTLVELLVVILIIGVLAAIAIPAFMNQRQQANVATLESNMKNMITAMHTYQLDNENFEGASGTGWTPGISGWLAIFRGSPDAAFVGTANTSGHPADFPSLTVDEGVGIGIVSSVSASPTGRSMGEFCIVGNMNNSPFEYTGLEDPYRWENAMYFDSRHGTLVPGSELKPSGACNSYFERIPSS